MVYLIYGDEEYLINKEINNIKNKYKDYDLVYYDMNEIDIKDAIIDVMMPSLFSSSKLIICENSLFLTGSKCSIDHDIDSLIKCLNSDIDSILVITVISDSLDKRKKVVKELEKKNVIVCNKLKDYELNNFIKSYCKEHKFKMNDDALNLFINKTINDLYIISSELDKLFIYKDDNTITKSDVEICTSRVINTNIFDLINSIVKGNIDDSMKYYDDLLLVNEEEIKLIVTLANQFRMIYQVKTMFRSGYSERDIVSALGVHPYRIKLANEVNITTDDALKYLKKLSILDEEIKTGKIDKKVGFEKFILDI